MVAKGYTFCYYVSGHGFGHATRVNQIITELLQSSISPPSTAMPNGQLAKPGVGSATGLIATTTIPSAASRHTIYIVSDAPQFIFQDVIALGAIYRNAKVDAGVVQPLAYSVDRQKTIEGVKSFLARREEMIQYEVSWLGQVGAKCVLADAPFLPCAAASAYGIPACLITNFTFDEVYRFLREGDPLDKDVIACADAALEDYKKASLLLRLPGSIDIPSFADEILTFESRPLVSSPSLSNRTGEDCDSRQQQIQEPDDDQRQHEQLANAVNGLQLQQHSRKNPQLSIDVFKIPVRPSVLRRRAIDVPLVVRKAINTRENVLRSLGVDEETIKTKKMVLISFGGQRLKQGWGSPLPDGWIGVICGLPVSHELPNGFYRSPHGVYVPDLTHAADIVIGKLGYGTCSECIAHDTPLIYVSRPQFIEEQGLIKLMINHGLPVEMMAEEFETGHWQRSILEADRLAQEEKEGRRLNQETFHEEEGVEGGGNREALGGNRSDGGLQRKLSKPNSSSLQRRTSRAKSLAESVNMAEMARGGPISPSVYDDDMPLLSPARSRRSDSISSLSSATFPSRVSSISGVSGNAAATKVVGSGNVVADGRKDLPMLDRDLQQPTAWFERRIPHDGGRVCAQLVEEYVRIWEEYHPK